MEKNKSEAGEGGGTEQTKKSQLWVKGGNPPHPEGEKGKFSISEIRSVPARGFSLNRKEWTKEENPITKKGGKESALIRKKQAQRMEGHLARGEGRAIS